MTDRRLLSLFVLTVLLGSSCGSPSGENANALETLTAASAKTNAAGTAKVEMKIAMDVDGQVLSMDAIGAMDLDKQLAHMTMTIGSDTPGMPAGGMGEIEMVMDGLEVYAKYPPEIAQSMPSDKPWAFIDMQAVGESQGMDYAAMAQTSGGDPSQILQYLNGVTDDIEDLGDEAIRGVATTHYKATIDLAKAADQAPADVRDAVRASIEAMEKQLGKSEIPVEVWIGEDGFVHRMTISFESDEGAQGPFKMDMTLDMFDFGAPVTVEIPPVSQVYDLTEMMTGMGAGSVP